MLIDIEKGREYTDKEFKQMVTDNPHMIFQIKDKGNRETFRPRHQYKSEEDRIFVLYGDDSGGFAYIDFYGKKKELINFHEGDLVSRRDEKLKVIYNDLKKNEKSAKNLHNAWKEGLSFNSDDDLKPVYEMGYTHDVVEAAKKMVIG